MKHFTTRDALQEICISGFNVLEVCDQLAVEGWPKKAIECFSRN